jgi:hypothetical protein
MPDLVAWGDVPSWISAAGVVATVMLQSVQSARQEWAQSFPTLVEELSDLDHDEIAHVVSEHPAIAELIGNAWETASKTAAHEKRWLLARVVCAALSASDDAEIAELPFFLRTIQAVEPPHIRLLVLIGTPRPLEGRFGLGPLAGCTAKSDLTGLWPQVSDMANPMLALLEREGLIEDVGVGTWGYSEPAWCLTGYARRFLAYLPGDDAWHALEGSAEVVLRLQGNQIFARNLGPGAAHSVVLRTPEGDVGLPDDLALGAECAFEIEAPDQLNRCLKIPIAVEWTDSAPHRSRTQTLSGID